jgi:flagellar hook protein FlgE
MMKSLSSAVSGLKSQQTAMDVIGNNIANVNTSGFKSSSTNFEDLFYNTLSAGTAETDPSQVGYGSEVQSVTKNMTSGGATTTSNPWNLYIDGEGYFAVSTTADATTASDYTRVGNLSFDTNGYLVDSNGNYVLGTYGSSSSDYSTNLKTICLGTSSAYYFVPTDGTTGTALSDTTAKVFKNMTDVTFNTDGSITATYNGKSGTIRTSNSTTGTAVKVALANFVNEGGLSSVGNNNYNATSSSGTAIYTVAGGTNSTTLESDALESSNVDISSEFTNMIITQRGFQANARVITTSDTMLEELVNLKRS